MKFLNFNLFVAVLFTTLILNGCKKDELRPAPTISFLTGENYVSADKTAYAAQEILAGIECQWNGTDLIRSLNIYANDQLVGTQLIPENFGTGFTIDSITLIKSQAPSEIWVFEVVDTQGEKGSVTFTLTLDETGGPILNFSPNPVIGAQANTTNYSYFNITENLIYSKEGAADNYAKVDVLAYYDATDLFQLISPDFGTLPEPYQTDMQDWVSKNGTRFCKTKLTVGQFDLINRDNLLISSFSSNAVDQLDRIKNLKADEIYAFKTQNGKYGLFKVTAVVPGTDGKITLQVKVQP